MSEQRPNPEVAITLRRIRREDDPAVAAIIRAVMTEFGAVGEGYSIEDPEVDAMFDAYQQPRAAFWVVESDGEILGCGGYAPLKGGAPDTCELQKMYFLPPLRGRGAGRRLMHRCLDGARKNGFRLCYLETLGNMDAARRLYRHFGFSDIDAPLGATGHGGCDRWMVLELDDTETAS
jgi:putative acetyltransferase